MKKILWLMPFVLLGCSGLKQKKQLSAYSYPTLKQQSDLFEQGLLSHLIPATGQVDVERDTVLLDKFSVVNLGREMPFQILVNGDTLKIYEMQTENEVFGSRDTVTYANMISEIKYYRKYDLLLFGLYFYPCTGMGCWVNYQVIYHTRSRKSVVFGRFATGNELELYDYGGPFPYYLSKSFMGRNAHGIDTVDYELYPVDFSSEKKMLQPVEGIYARFIYEDTLKSMKASWFP